MPKILANLYLFSIKKGFIKMFINALRNQLSDQKPAQMLGDAIKTAIAPFDPGAMVLRLTERLEGPAALIVEVGLFPDRPFVYHIDPFDDPDNQLRLAVTQATQYYRNRPSLPVEDHIVLGTE